MYTPIVKQTLDKVTWQTRSLHVAEKNEKACLYELPVQLMKHSPLACLLYLSYNKVLFVPDVSITEFGVYSGVTVITVEL